MTDKNVRAAVYLRVSLDATGEELAVARQREDCLAIVAARGWTVAEVYVDNSISASDAKKHRPAYERMTEDYKRGRFDALVCWDLDRLTRQPRQLEDWIDAAEEHGLLIVTANGEADLTTDAGIMFAGIKAQVARAEVRRKGARQSRAQRQRAQLGRPPKGVRLTGYTLAGGVIPTEADVVRRIFARFVAGDTLRSIAATLTEEEVPTRTGRTRWNPSTISGILRNARYAGRSTFMGEETGTAGTWPALVTGETYDAAQSILNDPRRKTNHRGTDRRWLGSGVYLCGDCDRPVYAWSGQRYRCPEGHLTRSGVQVDDYIMALTCERLTRPDLAELLVQERDAAELAELTERIKKARERLVVIEADYDAGHIDGRRYKAASDVVRADIESADRQQAALLATAGPESVLSADDPVKAFEAAPVMIQQRVLRALFDHIKLLPGKHGSKTFRPETVPFKWRGQA